MKLPTRLAEAFAGGGVACSTAAAFSALLVATSVATTPLQTPVAATGPPLPSLPAIAVRYETARDIPDRCFRDRESIYGRVVRVTDGDTMRIRHLPFYPFLRNGKYDGLLSEHTIAVRVYGVDAPEIGKFGNPSMPKAEEARDYARRLVGDKVVKVKLLRRDQYGRAVGAMSVRGWIPILLPRRDVSLNLARNGYATLYTGGGAEYNGDRSRLESLIDGARRRRRGIWSGGPDGVQTPAQYKRAVKRGVVAPAAGAGGY